MEIKPEEVAEINKEKGIESTISLSIIDKLHLLNYFILILPIYIQHFCVKLIGRSI